MYTFAGKFHKMKTLSLSTEQIISKLVQIENHLHRNSYFEYVPSYNFYANDLISVQKEARKMLDFVGLNAYTAVITFTKTKINEGGNIELGNSKEVFIEVSEDMRSNSNKALAVIAHEICHKVLYVHSLYYPNLTIENEVLTDLTTVYVGFGVLSLNGCYTQYQTVKSGYNQKTTTTHIDTVGYLSQSQFAIAYNIVCARYEVVNKYDNLNQFARRAVEDNNVISSLPLSSNLLKDTLKIVQDEDAEMLRSITLIDNYISQIKDILHKRHHQYNKDFILPFKLEEVEISNAMQAIEVLYKYSIKERSSHLSQTLDEVVNIIKRTSTEVFIDETALLNIECPQCGYKKSNALKEHKDFFLKCPKCKYHFVWKATKSEDRISEETSIKNEKLSIIKRIKRFFSKK